MKKNLLIATMIAFAQVSIHMHAVNNTKQTLINLPKTTIDYTKSNITAFANWSKERAQKFQNEGFFSGEFLYSLTILQAATEPISNYLIEKIVRQFGLTHADHLTKLIQSELASVNAEKAKKVSVYLVNAPEYFGVQAKGFDIFVSADLAKGQPLFAMQKALYYGFIAINQQPSSHILPLANYIAPLITICAIEKNGWLSNSPWKKIAAVSGASLLIGLPSEIIIQKSQAASPELQTKANAFAENYKKKLDEKYNTDLSENIN